MTRDGALPVLTLRRLNRATLARQLLLRRARLDVVDAIERVAALQAQWAPSPYVALWSRLAGFTRERLWSAIERHAVIRARLIAGTRHWIGSGRRPTEHAAVERLIRRCLGAFGPATLADICKFTGQVPARIRPVLDRLAPDLRRFADEQGRALFDLPLAPRPKAEVPAPVRFLPRYDEVLIAYQHRDRVIAPRHRPAIYAKNGIIEATLLVDGFVTGTWDLAASREQALLRIRPFESLAPPDRRAALDEGEQLARFLAPDARAHGVRVG